MTVSRDKIKQSVQKLSDEYAIKKATLFGSYADGSYNDDSDIDLLVEFMVPHVSLLTLSGLKLKLEELLQKDVDVIHAPLPSDSMIEINEEYVIYEA